MRNNTVIQADVPTINQRIYTKDVLQNMIDNQSNIVYLTFDSGYYGDIKLDQAIANVTKIGLDDSGFLYVEYNVLNTELGKMYKNLIDSDTKFKYSPTMLGTMADNSHVENLTLHSVQICTVKD